MVVFGIYITNFTNCIPLFYILFEDYKVVYDNDSNDNQKLDVNENTSDESKEESDIIIKNSEINDIIDKKSTQYDCDRFIIKVNKIRDIFVDTGMFKVGYNYCDYAICGEQWILKDNPKFLIWRTCCHIVFSYKGFGLNDDESYNYEIYKTDENPALDLLNIVQKLQNDSIISQTIKNKLSVINSNCCS